MPLAPFWGCQGRWTSIVLYDRGPNFIESKNERQSIIGTFKNYLDEIEIWLQPPWKWPLDLNDLRRG